MNGSVDVEEIKIRSQRLYPSKEELFRYKEKINGIEDRNVRIVVKLIMCSGFRIGEIMNSFLYTNEKNELFICGIAEKSISITKHKFDRSISRQSYAYPIDKLNLLFKSHPEMFKSVKLVNVLDLDIEELKDLASSYANPRWIIHELGSPTYFDIYTGLKKEFVVKTKAYISRLSEPISIEAKPSFHFFRKLFSTLYYYFVANKDLVQTIDYMKWQNPTIIFIYNKPFE